jgi:hypothetical protein
MSSHDDSVVPDSAMASGSDAGEPGEHLGRGDLAPDEQRLLEVLEEDATDPATDASEDQLIALRAAEDDAPLPEPGGPQEDGLAARFSDPEA